jgi:hypothetical protein
MNAQYKELLLGYSQSVGSEAASNGSHVFQIMFVIVILICF